jgi:hypothetical protein
MKMRLNKLLVPLAFSMLFSSGVSAAEEDVSDIVSPPTNCYVLAWNVMGLNTGQAVKLCSGTKDAAATIKCFLKAAASEEAKGLGLNMGLAVNLCKSNSEPF